MTRSGAPFHGAHGEGRSAISPAASQAGAEPCARACPAARTRRNAPVISDDAVVAAPMNRRAASTGDPLPCRARRHNWLKSWQKSIGHAGFGCAAALELEARSDQARRLRVPPAAAFGRRLRLFAYPISASRPRAELAPAEL